MPRFVLVLIAGLLSTCNFTPDGEVFTEVSPPDLSDVSITINYPYDTIKSFQDREIVYSVIGNEVEIAAAAVILDGDTLQIDQSTTGQFTLDVEALGTGQHTLRIFSTYATRTKSLEGVVLGEFFNVARNWPVVIDIDPPDPVQITQIETVNGLPVIHWTKYTRVNFQNYQLIKKCYQPASQVYLSCAYHLIQNQNTLSFQDTGYTGGPVEYYMVVTASYYTADGTPVRYP